MLGSCSTNAAARPPEWANGAHRAIGRAARLLSGCRTWRKESPHVTVGVAARRGRTCRTWRAVLQHHRDGPAAQPSVPAAVFLHSCRTDCAIGAVHAHGRGWDGYVGYVGYVRYVRYVGYVGYVGYDGYVRYVRYVGYVGVRRATGGPGNALGRRSIQMGLRAIAPSVPIAQHPKHSPATRSPVASRARDARG